MFALVGPSARAKLPPFMSAPVSDSMSALSLGLGRLGVHQDLLWFAVLLGWSLTLMLWWRSPGRTTGWSWLPWAAAAGIGTALLQFLTFSPPFDLFYERLVPGTNDTYSPAVIDPDLFADGALAVLFTGIACAWWWQRAGQVGARALRWPVVLLGIGLVVLHLRQPQLGGLLLALLPLKAITVLWPTTARQPWSRTALLLAALLPALSTIGPLAHELGGLQRSGPTGRCGAAFALAHWLCLAVTLIGLLREGARSLNREERRHLWRDARPFILGGLCWLVGGTYFALQSGRDNAQEVKTNRLRTTVSRASVMDPALFAPLQAGGLALAPIETRANGDRFTRPATLPPTAFQPLERELQAIVQSTPFLSSARFLILQDGWLAAIAFSPPAEVPGTIRLLRPATVKDVADWTAGRDVIESVPVPEAGQPYFCRAAVRDDRGTMLGWLEFVRGEFYSSMERKWRTGPLLVTALGTMLLAGFLVQRRSFQARETALREAAVAREAGLVKTAFLAKVSHELRTPLQSILGYSELLQSSVTDEAGRARLLALRQHGKLMTRLVNDLIDLSAVESGGFRLIEKPVAIAELVQQTVESFRPSAEAKGLGLGVRLLPGVPSWVQADAERVRQIVLNLVGNAVKFTDEGRVEVTLGVTSDGLLELAVHDTGPGISADDQPRIFEPFARLDLTASKEGAGLGLALVTGLCRSMGGSVTVESSPGEGACFRARWRARPTPEPGAPPCVVGLPLAGRRILIADDNALVRDLFAFYLRDLGAECTTAADGEIALTTALAENFDAAVIDLAMPRRDGFEVAQALRAAGRTLQLVGASAHADPADRERALASGMNVFLAKPVELAALSAALLPQAGPAPSAGLDQLFARLAEQFRQEAPGQIAALGTARDRLDWDALQAGAHYLKNSAAVVRDDRLFEACARVEKAALEKNTGALASAWSACGAALEPWLPKK